MSQFNNSLLNDSAQQPFGHSSPTPTVCGERPSLVCPGRTNEAAPSPAAPGPVGRCALAAGDGVGSSLRPDLCGQTGAVAEE